jgi:NADH dehydrogenase, FAD-containing subunit
MKRIVIIGGGYGGLLTALTARQHLLPQEAEITLINKQPEHHLVTELHRLAAGTISEKAVALPLSKLLQGKHVRLQTDTVVRLDPNVNNITMSDGNKLGYDYLVVALGSQTAFYGIPGLEKEAFTLKSIADANRIRAHIEARLDAYAAEGRPEDAAIVVGGGGLTGIELVGELADAMPAWCRRRGIPLQEVQLYNIEASPDILPGFEPVLTERARTSLERRGVRFITGVPVEAYRDRTVWLKDGRAIGANTLVWTGGVQGHDLLKRTDIDLLRDRVCVNRFLQSTSHPNLFAAGDCAYSLDEQGKPYPPAALLAWQMGECAGYNLFAAIKGRPMRAFEPVQSGKLASLGRKDAIASIGESRTLLTGLPASLMKEASKTRYLAHIRALFAYAWE